MDGRKLYSILKQTKLPVAQGVFKKETKPPFILFLSPQTRNFNADNRHHKEVNSWQVEFYSDKIDMKTEKFIGRLFAKNEICFSKIRCFIDSENLWQTLFEFEELE